VTYPEFIQIAAAGGYICADCGEFAPNGTVHDCGGTWSPNAVEEPTLPGSFEAWQRIAAALERIAELLEEGRCQQ